MPEIKSYMMNFSSGRPAGINVKLAQAFVCPLSLWEMVWVRGAGMASLILRDGKIAMPVGPRKLSCAEIHRVLGVR